MTMPMKKRMSSQTSHCHELCDLAGSSKPALRPHHQRPKPRPRRSGPQVSESVEKREVAHQASCLPRQSHRHWSLWRAGGSKLLIRLLVFQSQPLIFQSWAWGSRCRCSTGTLLFKFQKPLQQLGLSFTASPPTIGTNHELKATLDVADLHLDPAGGDGGLGRVHQQGAICNLPDNNFRF